MVRLAPLCILLLHGLSWVTVLEFMQISPLAQDKNDYFLFLLTLQLSSSQCCIITTYSLFASRHVSSPVWADVTRPGLSDLWVIWYSASSHHCTSSITILNRGVAEIPLIKHQHSHPPNTHSQHSRSFFRKFLFFQPFSQNLYPWIEIIQRKVEITEHQR